MTQPRRHFAVQFGLLLAVLTAGCGGDVVLPGEGEAAAIEIVDGDDQIALVGTALPKQVVVEVLDSRGRPVTDQEVSFSVESGGGSVAPASVATDDEGQAAAAWTLGPTVGDQLLRARTPRGGSGTLEVSFGATAMAGSGSNLEEVDGNEQTGPVNSALADSLVVRTTDALGNPVAGIEVTWTVAGGGSISPTTVVTGDDGLAAAERVLGASAGAQSAQAAVEDFSGSPITFTHTAEPANPTVLVMFAGDNQSAPAGFEVALDLVVRLEDANGNGIGARPITWVVPAGSGSVTPVNSTTNANGLAATRWTLPTVVGEHTVSAVFSGLPPVTFSGTATADVPTALEMVNGNGQSAPAGAALTNPLVVRVTDAGDNPVAGVSVTWTAVDGGTVSAEHTATNSEGLAEVTRTLGLTPGQYTTTAAVDDLQGSPVSFVSTATVGSPAKLAIVTEPGSPTVSGSAFSPSPVLQVQDAQGNPVPQGGIPIIATISSGQSGAALENEQRNTNANGRTTFTNLRISGPPATDYVLTFTAMFSGSPLTPVSTGLLTVTSGGANRLILSQQPSSSAQSGVPFPTQPVVQVVDGTGNPVAGNRTIEVEIGDGGGTLEGTLTASTGGGSTATFTDLAISGSLGSRTLLFTSGALTPAESSPINLTTGPAEEIEIQAGNNQTAAPGATLPTDPAVIIRDSGGNPVGGVVVTFTVTGGGGSASPSPVTTGSNGIAATNWTLGPAAGENELAASSSVGDVTFNATGEVETQSTTTTLSAAPDPPAPSGTSVTFTATVTSPGGTPTGTVEFRDGGSPIGSDDLDGGGQAVLQIVLGDGPHSITAHYQGAGGFTPSESSPPLSYEVSAANTPPEVGADAFPVNEDGVLVQPAPGVLANDDDADDDALTSQVVTSPANGTVSLSSNGSFTYTPSPDYNGPDQFTYRANDGQASSAAGTVSITVQDVNDDPSFIPGGDVSVSILQALAFSDQWATGIDPGAPNESTQGVEFQVTLDNPTDAGAFQAPPQISDDGTLTFSAFDVPLLAPRVIPLTVVLTDDGGGTSAPLSFSITIAPALGT